MCKRPQGLKRLTGDDDLIGMSASGAIGERGDVVDLKLASVREMNRQVFAFYPVSIVVSMALVAMFWSRAEPRSLLLWMAAMMATSAIAGLALKASIGQPDDRFWLIYRARLLTAQIPFSLAWGSFVVGPLNSSTADVDRYAGIVVLAATMTMVAANNDLEGFLAMQLPIVACIVIACFQLGDRGLGIFVMCYVATNIASNRRRQVRAWERQALLADNATMVSELEANRAHLIHEARTDPLTGLDNRRQFRRSVEHLQDSPALVGVLMVDLDLFKEVNDDGGHAAGDFVLCEVAERLRTVVRASDDIARLGGDEFAIVLDALADQAEAEAVAERLVEVVSLPYEFAGVTYEISASVGLAIGCGDDLFRLVDDADASLYLAKDAGRGRVVTAST